ncbi:MAG: phosphate acyltransferase PlsX [Verrucomicrobiota bacterium]
MKIAVDAMGGDHAPANNIGGVKLALESLSSIERLFLTGDKGKIEAELAQQQVPTDKIEIVHTTEVVGMDESPAKAVRRKKDSSISVAVGLVKEGSSDAVVSAGNTGAAVAAATLKLRNLPGVERAGIASALPSEHGVCNLIDAGANVDAKPRHLLQYAIMGAVYSREIFGVKNPKVGLMSVGSEEAKGNEFTRGVFSMLRESQLNFVGNIEGHDLFESGIDVVVCDGFTGNVVLKSCEATANILMKWLKAELTKTPLRMAGAWIARNAFRTLKKRGSYETIGGSPLLGTNGTTIIAHGSSSPLAMMNAIRVAAESIEHRVNPHIEEEIAKLAPPEKATPAQEEAVHA